MKARDRLADEPKLTAEMIDRGAEVIGIEVIARYETAASFDAQELATKVFLAMVAESPDRERWLTRAQIDKVREECA
jgi:hypothetical protein